MEKKNKTKTEKSLFIIGLRPLGHRVGDLSLEEARGMPRKDSVAKIAASEKITVNWLREHEGDVVRAVNANPFWHKNLCAVETGQVLNLSDFLRTLESLAYEKAQTIARPGEYAHRGGNVELWPINRGSRYHIEFYGNSIESIESLSEKRYRDKEHMQLFSRRFGSELIDALRPGDFVVHFDHGIGVFLEKKEIAGRETGRAQTYYVLEYAKGDRLMVPESKKEKLSLYVGLKTPEVHRLGSSAWSKTRRMVRASALIFAKELLQLYAHRELEKGYAFGPDDAHQKEFEESCSFEETLDQRVATDQIKADMEGGRPMERLLAGDVGFGKTEVAMRAAFKAVMAGKQVALLAPTTVLAYQHFRTFSDRMKSYPVRIALLSRLKLYETARETEGEVLQHIKNGSIDIIIGTHRLLSKDVRFKDLGLLIIDEEQKFGVKQKEKLKTLKTNLDVLLISATPIPRTLNLALAGLREMSIISTPPPGRMPIQTLVLPDSDEMIRKALLDELHRDGQVYVLWNRVETMALARKKIVELAPRNAKIEVAHGKMGEIALIEIMEKFRDRKIDILVATTIIENGLDFENVNTLVVMNATRLGLAQTYQLRGRIGRGDRQAYAYFFYPSSNSGKAELSENAKMRLEALEEFAELGSGYRVALRDLEIRGAGNMLGREQSGNIYRVGLNLYLSMLAEAVEELRGKEKK
ncbi:MAG: CarD family transcriptional regulator [bacterium]|nr:CarD family transcriptional regulator [bacterium]